MSRGLHFQNEDDLPPAMRARIHVSAKPDARECRAKDPTPKARKYHNEPTIVDGIRFDSKREARYYEQLKLRRAAGEVSYWLRQVPLHLAGGTRYVVDFLVFFTDGRPPQYVDAKGRETQVFRVKKREVEHAYPIRIELA